MTRRYTDTLMRISVLSCLGVSIFINNRYEQLVDNLLVRNHNLKLTCNEDIEISPPITKINQSRIIEARLQQLDPNISEDTIAKLVTSIVYFSNIYNIDPELVIAIMVTESNLNTQAISKVGAIGLMQVMPLWVEQLDWLESPADLLQMDKNIRAGTFIYRSYLDKFNGNHQLALLAYNKGITRVRREVRIGINPDNGYASKVLAQYNLMKESKIER